MKGFEHASKPLGRREPLMGSIGSYYYGGDTWRRAGLWTGILLAPIGLLISIFLFDQQRQREGMITLALSCVGLIPWAVVIGSGLQNP